MGLSKAGLGAIVTVAADTSANITGTVVASNKQRYIRGLLIFNTSSSTSQTCEIHVVPNDGSGGTGTAAFGNKIGKLTLTPADTAFFEFPYPLTLTSTGDCIQVVNDSGSTVNVLPIGDVES